MSATKAAGRQQCTLTSLVCAQPRNRRSGHFPSETHGMGLKSDDLSGGFVAPVMTQ